MKFISIHRKDRLASVGPIHFHSDLSGKCWVPDDTLPGRPGWYEDVPRRFYINTPWGSLTISPHGDDEKMFEFRKRPSV